MYEFAQNTTKLRRILDKMPNATEEQVKELYVTAGGLLAKISESEAVNEIVKNLYTEVTSKPVKKVAKKAVKKTK